MNLKSTSLMLAAFTVVGLAGSARAQETFSVPAGDCYEGPSSAGNSTYTTTATSSYIIGGTVNIVVGGTSTQVTAGSLASEGRIRMKNSGYPNLVLDFAPAPAYGAFTAGARTGTGSLIGSSIVSASTWNFEWFDSFDDGATLIDESISAFDFATTVGTAPTPPTTVHLISLPGTFGFRDAAGTVTNYTTTGGSAASPFVLFSNVVIKGGYWTNLVTNNNLSQSGVRLGHTAFPTLFSTFIPLAQGVSEGIGSVVGFGTNRTVTLSTTLLGAAIPTSGNFTVELYDTTASSGALAGVDEATATDLSFGLTADTSIVFSSPVLTGPFVAVGNAVSAGNGTFTIGSSPSNFIMRNQIKFSGVGTKGSTETTNSLAQTRLRVRVSSYPGMSAEFAPTTSTATTITVSNALLTSVGTSLTANTANMLKGASIGVGDVFTGELYDFFDNTGNDSSWANVVVTILAGDPIASATPPTAIDLGTISDASLTTTIIANTAPWSTGTVSWYKFTVPAGLNAQAGRFLDIWTTQPNTSTAATDTVLCLYTSTGKLVANDDDSGGLPQFLSQITYGVGSTTTPPWTVTATDLPFNGRDGDGLPAGQYYLGVCNYSATKGDGFLLTTTAPTTANDGTRINIRTNVPLPVQVLSGNLNLNDTSGAFAANRTISYSVVQGTSTVATGTVVSSASSTPYSITLPSTVTGASQIVWDGASFLKRKTNVNLTGSNQVVGAVAMQNGDVDNSGEVDAADIDAVIALFGDMTVTNEDVDVSGEVDAADIDIVVANFGGMDD